MRLANPLTHWKKLLLAAIFIPMLFVATVGASSCDDQANKKEQRAADVDFRWKNFETASQLFPLPAQSNFPMREALVKYTQRQDLKPHPWYIYVQVGEQQPSYVYYIGQTYPQSTCNFLSSTEGFTWLDTQNDNMGAHPYPIQAPSLDGIYYGSGSAAGGCDYFFFDMATDKMMVLSRNWKWLVSDGLTSLDAKPITVRTP